MVTGNASREIVTAAIANGATGYFLKPVRPAKVEEFMKKLLQR
jgi:DNA-binding NarL/FixJ family response regulator